MTSGENLNQSNNALQICKLTKRFRQGGHVIEALSDVSFDIERGSMVAIMGPSGSGKSTLMHLIAGLTLPDEGSIEIDGQNIQRMHDRQRTQFRRDKVGLVFQAFNLIPTISAEDNISLPHYAQAKKASIQASLNQIIERLGLQARRRHMPDSMSGGEQQRVAIARALITDPAVILADEPTGSLDTTTGREICQLLAELSREQQRTIIIVTHEPSVAVWAERVLVMNDGRLLDQFSTSELQDPLSLATRYQNVLDRGSARSQTI